MSDDSGSLRAGDLPVRNLSLDFDGIDDAAEAGAEDDADSRRDFRFAPNEIDCGVDRLNHGGRV
jgi:hypothetical protein